MLVKCLTHVWCQDETVLVPLVGIVYAEALSGGVCEPSDDIVLDDLCTL